MSAITRSILAHKRIVVSLWIVLTIAAMASAGAASTALKQKFSVPGREGWITNVEIARAFHGTGGNSAPPGAVVTLPPGQTAGSPAARTGLAEVERRLARILPGSRLAGWASTASPAFVAGGGRTTFIVAYPPADPSQPFGERAARLLRVEPSLAPRALPTGEAA
jgi:RND superfamily putative drug exporter